VHEDKPSSMQERFKKAINIVVNPKFTIKEDSYSRDFKYYVRHEQRTPSLDKLFDALMSADIRYIKID
jgi:hypothetical protein